MKDFFLQKPQKPLLVKKRVAKNKLAWWQPLPPVLSPLRGLGSLLAAGIIGNGIALGVLLGILVTAKVANAGQTNNNIIRPTENNLTATADNAPPIKGTINNNGLLVFAVGLSLGAYF